MSKTVTVTTLEELLEYLNDNGVLEIVQRRQGSAYKPFWNVIIDTSKEKEQQELSKQAAKIIKNSTKFDERGLSMLSNVAKVQNINLILNGLNFCATGIAFAFLLNKLESESNKITRQLNQLQSMIKQTQDIQNETIFNMVLADHTDMLDCQRKQQPYFEAQMRNLVDKEYNALYLLISSFQKGISEDNNATILAIFSLLSMFTISLRTFDELYYFNNHEVLGKDAWHLSHDNWMKVYDTLTQQWFIEKLQDYGTFETPLSTTEVDVYYISLMDQVRDCREEITDNQALIIAIGDRDLFQQYKELSTKNVIDSIEAAYREAGKDMDEATVTSTVQSVIQQMYIA